MGQYLVKPDSYGLVDFFDNMFKDFDSFWDDFDLERRPYACRPLPATDIFVNENKDLVFEFALAGYPEDAIRLDFEGDYLLLHIDRKEEKTEDKKHYLYKGLKRSQIQERFYVPFSKYNREETSAELKNGLLHVVVPAKEEIKPKQVEIKKS